MQDLSRDEMNLLHSGCDKDPILANVDTSIERLKLSHTTDLEPLPASIKLEDNGDSFPWHTFNADIASNLL